MNMKGLKEYINESLADGTSNEAIKTEIINWIKDNVKSIKEDNLKIEFDTKPIIVNYVGDIKFKNNITSLTSGTFQWGEVNGIFDCSHCTSLKTLEGAPKYVEGDFDCSFCDKLKTLYGAPNEVGGVFTCSDCTSLVSLNGAPKKVGYNFDCSACNSLKSLVGAPKNIIGNFSCSLCNSLKSLNGAPKEVGGHFFCKDYGFTEDDVKKISKVTGEIIC